MTAALFLGISLSHSLRFLDNLQIPLILEKMTLIIVYVVSTFWSSSQFILTRNLVLLEIIQDDGWNIGMMG